MQVILDKFSYEVTSEKVKLINEMIELDEARNKIETILEAGDVFLNPPDDLADFISKREVKESRVDQILNLKGDGWRIAIIKDTIRECADEDGVIRKYRSKQVIWEAEDGQVESKN